MMNNNEMDSSHDFFKNKDHIKSDIYFFFKYFL